MAEVVYKKISELDNATVPLTGSELIGVSATGVSKKASVEGMHGAGWWTKLKAAFADFIAPEAIHAVDSDTCGTEAPSDFHDAAQLTGAIHLDRIPVELTGKNAATATVAASCTGNAATATVAASCTGNAATATTVTGIKKAAFSITAPATTGMTENDIFDIIAPFIPNTNDRIICSGALLSKYYPGDWQLCCSLVRASASTINISGVTIGSDNKARTDSLVNGDTTLRYGYITG